MKQKLKKLRTVALRILPVLVVFAIVLTMVPSASAAVTYFDLSLDSTQWQLFGNHSDKLIASGGNPSYFLLDHSQLDGENSYDLSCYLGAFHIASLSSNSLVDMAFSFECSIQESDYYLGGVFLTVFYVDANGSGVSSYEVQVNGKFNEIFHVDELFLDNSISDFVYFYVRFEDFDLKNFQDLGEVGFVVDSVRLSVQSFYSPDSVFVYEDQTLVTTFEDAVFPCTINVIQNGFTVTNAGSDVPNFIYVVPDDRAFYGLKQNSLESSEFFPVGATFKLQNSDRLYLLTELDVGHVSIFNYTGSYLIDELPDAVVPCTVFVGSDGLHFSYAGSDDVDLYFPYGSIENVEGVSVIPSDDVLRYPIGSSFTLTRVTSIYLICADDLSLFPPFDVPGDSPGFDPDDFDSSYVDGVFSEFSEKINSYFNYIFQLFWRSELLHSILLMSAVFSIFSFLMFGKKG